MGPTDDITRLLFPQIQTIFRNIQMRHYSSTQDVLSQPQGLLLNGWLAGLCNPTSKAHSKDEINQCVDVCNFSEECWSLVSRPCLPWEKVIS